MMSGFSKEWLALREPADAFARDISLLARMEIKQADEFRVIDLGTGGSWFSRPRAARRAEASAGSAGPAAGPVGFRRWGR